MKKEINKVNIFGMKVTIKEFHIYNASTKRKVGIETNFYHQNKRFQTFTQLF